MRKSFRITLLVGGIFCGAGLLMGTVAYAIAGFHTENFLLEDQKMETKTYTDSIEKLENFEIRAYDRKINVILTQDNTLKIVYRERKNEENQADFQETTTEGGGRTLRMDCVSKYKWWQHISIGFWFTPDYSIDVYLPASYRNNIDFETSNASIQVEKLELDGTLKLKTSNSSINLKNLSAKDIELKSTNAHLTLVDSAATEEIRLETTNGGIDGERLTANTLVFTTTNAGMSLNSLKAADKFSARTTNGKISAAEITAEDAELQSTNSGMSLTNVGVKNDLDVRTTNGKLTMERIFGNELLLKSTNAGISGTIKGKIGDYNITSKTTNGSNNLPNQINAAGGKQLTVDTTNGRIAIDFVE